MACGGCLSGTALIGGCRSPRSATCYEGLSTSIASPVSRSPNARVLSVFIAINAYSLLAILLARVHSRYALRRLRGLVGGAPADKEGETDDGF